MATSASNTFSIGIRAPVVGTFSMPTVQDERDTYTRWGWTWTESTANPVYNSAGTYSITNPDIHGDTECDDVWAYVQAYNRRASGRDGYLQRAQAWRNYYVNNFEGSSEYGNDANNFGYDHFYGWGLQQYADQFNDAGAAAEALRIAMTLRTFWSTGGRSGGGNWPVAGQFDMAHYGHRGVARNLHTAVAVADSTQNPLIVELRDRLLDLWLQSPDWDDTHGMYWVASDQMGFYDLTPPNGPLSFAAGDRAVSSFHIGQVAEAFFAAWLSPTVSASRKAALRAKIVAMATWMRANGLDPTYRYSSNTLGIRGSGGAWWNYSLEQPVNSWDGTYTISLVNLLVLGYKFTGDSTFLTGSPPAGSTNGPYSAQYCFNRGTKSVYGSTTLRETGPNGQHGAGGGNENVAWHFMDTQFDTSSGNVYLSFNKGELQYTYLIFENGGAPTLL
jgi:hypothetical protein